MAVEIWIARNKLNGESQAFYSKVEMNNWIEKECKENSVQKNDFEYAKQIVC